jgi:hypothetical protein
MNIELAELLQKKQSQPAGGIDLDERRDRYTTAVQERYAHIEQALAVPVEQKTVILRRRKKDLTENYVGTYSIDDLIILIGNEQVRFSPRGQNVAGGNGRVDVLGENGEATLLLQVDGRWGFLQSRQPTLRIAPFDEAALAEVLKIVMKD